MRKLALWAISFFMFAGVLLGALSSAEAGHSYRAARYAAYGVDPYAYRYEPRGYYPYYNSGYWRPAHEMRRKRARYYSRKPRYYKAWGYPKRGYHHRSWHKAHHGGHWHGHW